MDGANPKPWAAVARVPSGIALSMNPFPIRAGSPVSTAAAPVRTAAAAVGCLCLPAAADAHVFAQPYGLPVPFSLYAGGAAAALLVSFAMVGLFAGAPSLGRVVAPRDAGARPRGETRGDGIGLAVGRGLGLLLLIVCVATGLFGTQNAFANFNMTFFWIVFVLGVAYAVAVVGDFYAALNPWRVLVDAIARAGALSFAGRLARPERLHAWPALALYAAFIWVELFARVGPRGLSWLLLAYTAVNIAGAWWLGRDAWFRQGEFFAVFLRLLGKMSPWARPWGVQAAPGAPRWRPPFTGLLDERADHVSLLLFILFMLSSTAFDGLHDTTPWAAVFWKGIYPWLGPLVPTAAGQLYAVSAQLYHGWQGLALLLSPFAYLAVYAGFVGLVKVVTGSAESVGALMLRFAMSLLPIAFVYHLTHYYTLLLAQGGQIVRLASDPFGIGWDLFGTATRAVAPVMVDVETIWHTQVALIVAGHIVGVWLAHVEALRAFSTPRRAALSQLPMLALMVMFTTLGLWILSLPFAGVS